MRSISVLIAEDHTIVRKGLCALLEESEHIKVIGDAENGHEAIKKTLELQPDIVLMDISMPILNGLEATRRIKSDNPDIRVIILSMHANAEYILQGLQAGAESFLLKESAPEELIKAIETTQNDESYWSPLISKRFRDEFASLRTESLTIDRYDSLTNRERDVLQLIAEGFDIHGISEHLVISEKTARVHRTNLMTKLHIHSIAELTLYALRKGVISLEK